MVEESKNPAQNEPNDIDFILKDIGGTFGKFQIYNYLMLSFAMFVAGNYVLDYVFSTLELDHRCAIPECEDLDNVMLNDFNPDWLEYSVPFKNGKPEKCYRFDVVQNVNASENECNIYSFNRSAFSYCAKDVMVYRTDDVSIVKEFNLTCDENRWKLAMVGTFSNIGRLLFLPMWGYISDRYGRKTVLVSALLIGSSMKLLKTFATNYNLFVLLELLDAGSFSGTYPSALILATEWVTAEHRILAACATIAWTPIGQSFAAFISFYLPNYKWLLRVLSLFGFLTLPYIWLIPESFRWLLVNRKYDEAIKVIERAAKMNGIDLSPKTREIIALKCQKSDANESTTNQPNNGTFMDIIRSCSLLTRLSVCAFCWISSIFLTYGISLTATSLKGDKRTNFLIVSLGSVPSAMVTYLMLTYLNRRRVTNISYIVTGAAILASKLLSTHHSISLIFFFIGKLFSQHSVNVIYLYTNEMWPTVLRHRVMGICSTMGRVGSITAPLAPLLISIMEMLPFYLFSGVAFVAALVCLFLPETFRQEKLPDSISDIKRQYKRKEKPTQNQHL